MKAILRLFTSLYCVFLFMVVINGEYDPLAYRKYKPWSEEIKAASESRGTILEPVTSQTEKEPRFSIGLGTLAPSYSQKFGDGKTRLDFNSQKDGYSYSISNVQHSAPGSQAKSDSTTPGKQADRNDPQPYNPSHYYQPGQPQFSIYQRQQITPAPVYNNPPVIYGNSGASNSGQFQPLIQNAGQYSPIQNTGQYNPIQSNGGQYQPIQSNGGQYQPIQSNGGQYSPVQSNTRQYNPVNPLSSHLTYSPGPAQQSFQQNYQPNYQSPSYPANYGSGNRYQDVAASAQQTSTVVTQPNQANGQQQQQQAGLPLNNYPAIHPLMQEYALLAAAANLPYSSVASPYSGQSLMGSASTNNNQYGFPMSSMMGSMGSLGSLGSMGSSMGSMGSYGYNGLNPYSSLTTSSSNPLLSLLGLGGGSGSGSGLGGYPFGLY